MSILRVVDRYWGVSVRADDGDRTRRLQSVAPTGPRFTLDLSNSGGTVRALSPSRLAAIECTHVQFNRISSSRRSCLMLWKNGIEYRGVDPVGGDRTRWEVARASP
jgi:hypothetical protein